MAKKRLVTAECIEHKSDPKIKVAGEHRRSAVFYNDQRSPFRVIKVDNCLVMNKLAADWIVSSVTVGDLVIELKGRDVGHALVQIGATLSDWTTHPERTLGSRLAALIVCEAQKPQVTAQRQRAERRFRRDYGAKLFVFSGNREYDYEYFFA